MNFQNSHNDFLQQYLRVTWFLPCLREEGVVNYGLYSEILGSTIATASEMSGSRHNVKITNGCNARSIFRSVHVPRKRIRQSTVEAGSIFRDGTVGLQ